MRNLLFAICCFATAVFAVRTGVVHAEIITIDNIDPFFSDDDADNRTYSGFVADPNDADGNSWTLTGTSDFDSGGVADTLEFTLTRRTYVNSTITGGNVTVGAVNDGGNINNWNTSFGDGDTLELEVTNITFTSGEMDGTTAVFAGFTNLRRVDFNGSEDNDIDYLVHTGSVGSTPLTSAAMTTAIDLTSAGNSSTVFVTAEPGVGAIRLRDLDLQFETIVAPVPEPSLLALLSLGVVGWVTRRRRR